MEQDKTLIDAIKKHQRETLDTDTLLAQDAFDERVRRGETLLVAFKSGIITPNELDDKKDCKDFSKMLLDLVATVAWLRVQQTYFCEWPGQTSEATYIQAANYLKERTSFVDSDECWDLVSRIAMCKAGGDEERAKKVLGICTKVIDDELVRSGYVHKISRDENTKS